MPVESNRLDVMERILHLSIGGAETPYICQQLGLTCKQLQPYLTYISMQGLGHVTSKYCETTYGGACFLTDYKKLKETLQD